MHQYWIDEMLFQSDYPNHVYVIEMKRNLVNWFLFGISNTSHLQKVYWTPMIRQAHIFLTEENVEEFKCQYISPRKVSIVRISSYDAMLCY